MPATPQEAQLLWLRLHLRIMSGEDQGYEGPFPRLQIVPLTFGRLRIVQADSKYSNSHFW